MRLRATVLMAALIALAAHLAVTLARTDTLDPAVLAVDAALALLLLIAVYAHLHGLVRERQQHVMSTLFLELTMEPRPIHETAGRALELIVEGGLAEAGVLAIARGGEWLPIATASYPDRWLDDAPSVHRDPAITAPAPLANPADHAWGAALTAVLGTRPRGALVPVGVDHDEPIGMLLLAARRAGPLRDQATLVLTGRAVGAALHHAELFEAAYARERALEAQSLRRREFLTTLADEVRAPVASIAALADLVVDHPGDARDRGARGRLLTSLARGVERLELLVNELIRQDGDDPNALHPVPELTDISEAMRLAEAVLRPAFTLGEQSLTFELPERPVIAYADPGHVEQVVLNLLSNANRRTPMGGRVHVRLISPDDRSVRIEVEDSGLPIPEAERERIFELLGQGVGSGVSGEFGLDVARRLAVIQHGRVWVEETPTGGARFCVELPGPAAGPTRVATGG